MIRIPRLLRIPLLAIILPMTAVSVLRAATGDVLYNNRIDSAADISRLSLYRGANLVSTEFTALGGRTSTVLKCTQTAASEWLSILGEPNIANVTEATINYLVFFPSDAWQFRLQGKLPGLTPDSPHFGGSADDPVEWNKWSVRLMWLSTSSNIRNGDDSKAQPSVYIYDQNRQLGNTGTHNRVAYNFPKDQWLAISLSVKLNTHNGAIANSDGVVKLYIDGVLKHTVSGLKLIGDVPAGRNANEARISKIAFHNYYGGNKGDPLNVPTTATSTCYFDDIIVTEGLVPGVSEVVSAPAFSTPGGTYASAQTVAVTSSTEGANIRYTIDGSDPTAATGTLYTGAITLPSSTIVKAIAYKLGASDSAVSSAIYTITSPAPAPRPAQPLSTVLTTTPILRNGLVVGRKFEGLENGQSATQYILTLPGSVPGSYTDATTGLSFSGRYAIITDRGNNAISFYANSGSALSYKDRHVRSASGLNTLFSVQFASDRAPVVSAIAPVMVYDTLTPTISSLPDVSMKQDTSTVPLAFTVGDPANDVEKLIVTASSSNQSVLRSSGIVFSGTGSARWVVITPLAGASGTTTVTLTVSDGTATATTSFNVNVVGTVLFSLPSNTSVRDNNGISDVNNGTTLLGSGGNAPYVDRCTVYVFQLPDLGPVTNPFSAATFTFNYALKQGVLKTNDMYGLGRRTSPVVLTTDYHGSTTAIDTTDATLLQTNILTDLTPLGLVTTSLGGSVALTDYLNAQYAGGAGIGQYVFIRLNTSQPKDGVNRATLTMAQGGVASPIDTRPRINFSVAP